MISQDYLKSILSYDELTGDFAWLVCKGRGVKVGMIAGRKGNDGYVGIGMDGKKYPAHILAWVYSYGSIPDGQIDHINHNRSDNRLDNLRDVTRKENQRNRTLNKNNTSGFCGITKTTKSERWQVQVGINGKSVYVGCFKSKDEAVKARDKAYKENNYHINHGVK